MMISRMCTVLLIAAVILTPLPAVAAGEPNPAPQQEGIPAAGEEPFSTRPADTQTAGHETGTDHQPFPYTPLNPPPRGLTETSGGTLPITKKKQDN